MERFLLARIVERDADPIVATAVRTIRTARGTLKIRDLAISLGISQVRLEKRFRVAVGSSPKQFASIIRVRNAVDAYRPGVNMAEWRCWLATTISPTSPETSAGSLDLLRSVFSLGTHTAKALARETNLAALRCCTAGGGRRSRKQR